MLHIVPTVDDEPNVYVLLTMARNLGQKDPSSLRDTEMIVRKGSFPQSRARTLALALIAC